MEESKNLEQKMQELQDKLEQTQNELEHIRENQSVVQTQTNPTDKLLDTIIDKGSDFLTQYFVQSAETEKYNSDRAAELEKEELRIINKLDNKEKLYKGVLIGVCVGSLVLSAFFIEKAEVVIPVLSLVIGLLFKSSSLSEFFKHRKNKTTNKSEED